MRCWIVITDTCEPMHAVDEEQREFIPMYILKKDAESAAESAGLDDYRINPIVV